VARRDVEEAELIGACGVISRCCLDRIASVDEIDEVDALDDAAVPHVEAGDDAHLQHGGTSATGAGRRARKNRAP
jgi:hypothetical protein